VKVRSAFCFDARANARLIAIQFFEVHADTRSMAAVMQCRALRAGLLPPREWREL